MGPPCAGAAAVRGPIIADRHQLAQQRSLAKHFAERRAAQADTSAPESSFGTDADTKYWESIGKLRADRADLDRMKLDDEAKLDEYKRRHEDTVQDAAEEDAAFR